MDVRKTKHQRFSVESVLRSDIKEHPRNPRKISDSARKKIKAKMSDVGLLQPIIINKTTGYILSGHQRVSALDSLEGYGRGKNNYALDVAVVELSDKDEVQMLVFLNNQSAMGVWDIDLLGDIALDLGDLSSLGFDKLDGELLFSGDARFSSIFDDSIAAQEDKGDIASIKEENRKTGRVSGLDAFEAQKDNPTDLSADFYVTVICKDQIEKRNLLKALGIPVGEIYIRPDEIINKISKDKMK